MQAPAVVTGSLTCNVSVPSNGRSLFVIFGRHDVSGSAVPEEGDRQINHRCGLPRFQPCLPMRWWWSSSAESRRWDLTEPPATAMSGAPVMMALGQAPLSGLLWGSDWLASLEESLRCYVPPSPNRERRALPGIWGSIRSSEPRQRKEGGSRLTG